MALPTILVHSGGSDTQASGAGPSTALFGTTDASTDGAGTVVTLTAGTDTTNVATDGSHVIYLADSTAGARNFGKITAKAGSGGATPTVTVADAFGLTLSGKSWAIGGKRATLDHADTRKLFNNNSASGDAMPGWKIDVQDNQTLNTTGQALYRAGDNTTGHIEVFSSNAGVVINQTANTFNFQNRANYWHFRNLKLTNSNGTKTSAVAISAIAGYVIFCTDCIFGDVTNTIGTALLGQNARLRNCTIVYCTSTALNVGGSGFTIINCILRNNAGIAIGGTGFYTIVGCLIYDNAGDAINAASSLVCHHCTIHNNTGDGIDLSAGLSTAFGAYIANNHITKNGGYGIRCPAAADLVSIYEDYNNFGTGSLANTSGATLNLTQGANDQATDPQYANAAGGDFTPRVSAMRGDITPIGGTVSHYAWPGAIQPTPDFPDESEVEDGVLFDNDELEGTFAGGGGGALLRPVGMTGGLV